MKKDFMENVKKESKKESKTFIENVSILYDVFNENPISYNEYKIWEYIKEMELAEMGEMFISIITKLDRLDLCECYLNPLLFKFLVCEYIQELRLIDRSLQIQ